MDDKQLDQLWKTLSLATNIDHLEYDEAVTIGSVFGEMKAEIKRLRKNSKVYSGMLNQCQVENSILVHKLEMTNANTK